MCRVHMPILLRKYKQCTLYYVQSIHEGNINLHNAPERGRESHLAHRLHTNVDIIPVRHYGPSCAGRTGRRRKNHPRLRPFHTHTTTFIPGLPSDANFAFFSLFFFTFLLLPYHFGLLFLVSLTHFSGDTFNKNNKKKEKR